MLRGQDVILLLSLANEPAQLRIRDLASDLGYNPASTLRALVRLEESGLYDRQRGRVPAAAVEEFCVHAVKYVFPARLGSETRGVPAAWATEPLTSMLAPLDELPPVWPSPEGETRGLALEPLHEIAISAARRNPWLGRRLAAVDTLRAGDARLRSLATEALIHELRTEPQ